MGVPAHDPTALAEFQDGETRLVYARYRDRPDDPPFYLEEGRAASLRTWAKAHLECFMPECADRRLTTVARTKKRDGFKHFSGSGGHSPEGLFHQQAKALIVRWVQERFPEVRAISEQTTESRTRRADVMLTWPSGRQLAVEVQYAALSPSDWLARHRSYQEQGIADVWLLGHLPPHLRPSRVATGERLNTDGLIAISPLHEVMASEGVPLLWINPIDERIGTVWVDQWAHVCRTATCDIEVTAEDWFAVHPRGRVAAERAYFAADCISECNVSPAGIVTPTLRELLESQAAYERALELDAERQAAAIAAEGRRRAAEARRAADAEARRIAALAEQERLLAWLETQRASQAAVWQSAQLREKVIRRYGKIPSVFSANLVAADGVFAHPEYWRAVLYGDLVLARPAGTRFGVGDCYKVLRRHGIELNPADPALRAAAIVNFLKHLERHDIVRIHYERRSSGNIASVEVLATIEAAEEHRAERTREQRRLEAERRVEAERAHSARERQSAGRSATLAQKLAEWPQAQDGHRVPQETSSALSAITTTEDRARHTHCLACGSPLAEVLAFVGLHVGCAPFISR